MEAISEGRAEYAATLADLGFVTGDFVQHTRRRGSRAGAGGGGGPKPFAGPGGVDEHAGNARIVKAALCAGFYPSVLRVEHPPAKYKNVKGGAFAVRQKTGSSVQAKTSPLASFGTMALMHAMLPGVGLRL